MGGSLDDGEKVILSGYIEVLKMLKLQITFLINHD